MRLTSEPLLPPGGRTADSRNRPLTVNPGDAKSTTGGLASQHLDQPPRGRLAMENVLAINFTRDSDAYQALTKLGELDEQGQVTLKGAAVVFREDDGTITIKDEVGDIGYTGTATGGIVGLVVGVIGGPIGVLLGGATGVLIGSLFDIDDLDETES